MSTHVDTDVECVVVGAGVVGLAIARALAQSGREVLVLDGAPGIGQGTSSRNSEVVHAGIYYTPGSLKARLCVQGREQLYAFCQERGVAHAMLGKLIVAAEPAELPALDQIAATAAANGVPLIRLTAAEARAMEPALRVAGALHSPRTGIVDSHALMLAMEGELTTAGGSVVCRAPVQGGTVQGGTVGEGFTLNVGGAEPMQLSCRILINAAGLHAPALAQALGLHAPPAFLAKGSYYSLQGRAPFQRLVYPVPEPGGLGVHLTLDLAMQARFGPDVQWVDHEDYDVDPRRADGFYAAIRRYWPDLPDGALVPGYAGIRPKITGPGEANADFRIDGPAEHGRRNLVQLFGIESPGLTASLAIGDHVAGLVNGRNAA